MQPRVFDASSILFEDENLVAIHKPDGLQVENDKFNHPSVESYCKDYFQQKGIRFPYVGIVHRLDRPTSGVLIIAKKISVLKSLNKQIEEKKWTKIYYAWVENPVLTSGKLTHYLVKNTLEKKAEIYDSITPDAKKAELEFSIVKQSSNYTLLKIHLITGRYHQIRAQFAYIGNPVVGDQFYGAKSECNLLLQCKSISFSHPISNEKLKIETPLFLDLPFV